MTSPPLRISQNSFNLLGVAFPYFQSKQKHNTLNIYFILLVCKSIQISLKQTKNTLYLYFHLDPVIYCYSHSQTVVRLQRIARIIIIFTLLIIFIIGLIIINFIVYVAIFNVIITIATMMDN